MAASRATQILVCNVGWMARYQGLWRQPDSIVGGGQWVVDNKEGHESCNFLPNSSGEVFGHFETIKGERDREVSIHKLGVDRDAEAVHGVDVVWVATEPNKGGRRVVGYYRDATVYRHRQQHPVTPTKQHKQDKVTTYRILAKSANIRCLVPEERVISLGRPPGWIGQANWWFPALSDHPDVPAFLKKVRKLLDSHGVVDGGSGRKKFKRSNDPERNALVEQAATAAVRQYFGNFHIDSVELDNVGWDLEVYQQGESKATGGNPVYCVEVKGLSGHTLTVGVTPNEYRCVQAHIDGNLPSYRIAVVTAALSIPSLKVFAYDQGKRTWVDEVHGSAVNLQVKESLAAMLSLGS